MSHALPPGVQLLIDLGLYVLPAAGKRPIIPDWQARSSRADHVIRRWGQRWPNLSYAVDCGKSNVLVVDLDGGAGQGCWDGIVSRHVCPATRIASTPNDGKHIYYRVPAAMRLRNTVSFLGPGIDTRQAGGLVITPPSAGRRWLNDLAIADVPQWLLDELKAPEPRPAVPISDVTYAMGATRYGESALRRVLNVIAVTREGTRNRKLLDCTREIAQLTRAGHLPVQARQELIEAGLSVGLSRRETEQTVSSAWEYGLTHPNPNIPKPLWGGGDFAGHYVEQRAS